LLFQKLLLLKPRPENNRISKVDTCDVTGQWKSAFAE